MDAEELHVEAALRSGRHDDGARAGAGRWSREAPLRERRWALLALAQYQAGRQGEALRHAATVRGRAGQASSGWTRARSSCALEQAILRQDPSLVVRAALPEPSPVCPYRGLLPYDVEDADAFFGREADIAACLDRLRRARGPGRRRAVRVRQVVAGAGRGRGRAAVGTGARVRRDDARARIRWTRWPRLPHAQR